jgi:phenylalanine-4-hydroxylase
MNALEDVPAHLREFVVRQAYDEYTEEDQAVWRFAVLNTHVRLRETAHEMYARGFEAAGISVDRIPRIDEMSECLSRFGWRAVCVDGFIPPRAFQAFQARGVLPIAADIRTSRHLTYTPAPDIIHEAAGHAPFLAEPHYARYLKRIGGVAEKAFASRADRQVYDAIYRLSEVKEDPASTAFQVASAEQALERAARALGPASESAKIARLYWWTAEYGLVGTPTDYRLYGAGLLSSIGEGHFCREPGVQKLPLSAACIDVDYDITRAQPQLFVARSFSHLEDVLDEVARGLAFRIGGDYALEVARGSEETATLELDSGVDVSGVVAGIHGSGDALSLVELTGPCALSRNDALLDAMPRTDGYVLPLGVLEDGRPLSSVSVEDVARYTEADGRLALRLRSGIVVSGRVRALLPVDGRVLVVLLAESEVRRGDGRVLRRSEAPYPVALAARVTTARAGAPDGFYPPTEPSTVTVPKPRTFEAAQRALIGLYERGREASRTLGGATLAREYESIVARLDAEYPDDWLLRWNLLESLVKAGERGGALAERLERDLEALEIRYRHLEPIATGLSYIRSLVSGAPASERTERARPTFSGR